MKIYYSEDKQIVLCQVGDGKLCPIPAFAVDCLPPEDDPVYGEMSGYDSYEEARGEAEDSGVSFPETPEPIEYTPEEN